MRHNRDELDDLINGALPGYSKAHPMDGLEERVLRRVRTAGIARRRVWPLRLAFAAPAFAALLIAGVVLPVIWNSVPHTTNRPPEVAHLKPPAPPVESPKLTAQTPARAKPLVRNRTVRGAGAPSVMLPKRQVFPSPLPATAEELALLAWTGRAPVEARQAFLDLQKRMHEPVAIERIQIEPLRSDGAQ